MKTIDIKHIKAARKYSKALFQTAKETGLNEKVYSDLVFISETINTNEQLKNALMNPIVTLNDKKDIFERIFKIHIEKVTLDFILLLLENNRLDCLDEVINCFNQSNNIENNIITPTIISAVELNDEQKNRIISKIEEKTGKKVIPEYTVKKDIIGGIIIEIDDKTIDLSINTKFDNMKKQLTKGNNYGNN